MEYIATFYIHYSAIKFARDLSKKGYTANPTPVPRQISSSCGTCVQFKTDTATNIFADISSVTDDNLESLFCKQDNIYKRIYL